MRVLLLVLVTVGVAAGVVDQNRVANTIAETSEFGGEIWAVLVAGSKTYDNYRHQADVCHSYQILRRNGIPSDRIITMMYDDIANNTKNPTKGVVINRPGGPDVYSGVVIDYAGREVSCEGGVS